MTAVANTSLSVLSGISWETYQETLRDLDAAGRRLRVTYDRGRMVLMSPRPIHEKWKQLIGRLVEVLAEHRNLPISAYGSTTWKREILSRGLEADQCYYIQRVSEIRGKLEIDLDVDAPPDLAIEVDVTHSPLDRMQIYASLKIPEVWHYDGQRIECLILAGDNYTKETDSRAFPGFQPVNLDRFLAMHPQSVDSEIAKAFREWLK